MKVDQWDADTWLDIRAEIGEGPIWDHRCGVLIFVDIPAGELYSVDLEGCATVRGIGRALGAVGLRGESGYVLATSNGFATMDADGAVEVLSNLVLNEEVVRMNDAQVGPDAALWSGTIAWDARKGAGILYRLSSQGEVRTVLDGVTISNGIGWSLDNRTMYYIDSATRSVEAFDFDVESGTIANRRMFAKVSDGLPDGLCVDDEGSVWVAVYDGGVVHRYSPDGTLTGSVRVPARFATSCCFGGANLDLLFITSGSANLSPSERHAQHAGAVFVANVGVRGRTANLFPGPKPAETVLRK